MQLVVLVVARPPRCVEQPLQRGTVGIVCVAPWLRDADRLWLGRSARRLARRAASGAPAQRAHPNANHAERACP